MAFVNNSITKFILKNAAIIILNDESKNSIRPKYKVNVLTIGAIIADKISANLLFLFLNILYTNALAKPHSAPFNKHIDIVIKGREANIAAPPTSLPLITIMDTIIPKTSPIIVPTFGPYIAPDIMIGINVKVIGKPDILINVESVCNNMIITANILMVVISFIFIL